MRHVEQLVWSISLGFCAMAAAPAGSLAAGPIGPLPYLNFDDSVPGHGGAISPFFGQSFSYFHLENFEDHLFNVPGVSADVGGVTSVDFGPSIHDSVDADDGTIDGSGLNGDSYFSCSPITFIFDAGVLDTLPTHVGIVWTDGGNTITVEGFDAGGASLGIITGTHADPVVSGTTAEDRFYGFVHDAGISAITIGNPGCTELDHLQYGFAPTPAPAMSDHGMVAMTVLILWAGMVVARRSVGHPLSR